MYECESDPFLANSEDLGNEDEALQEIDSFLNLPPKNVVPKKENNRIFSNISNQSKNIDERKPELSPIALTSYQKKVEIKDDKNIVLSDCEKMDFEFSDSGSDDLPFGGDTRNTKKSQNTLQKNDIPVNTNIINDEDEFLIPDSASPVETLSEIKKENIIKDEYKESNDNSMFGATSDISIPDLSEIEDDKTLPKSTRDEKCSDEKSKKQSENSTKEKNEANDKGKTSDKRESNCKEEIDKKQLKKNDLNAIENVDIEIPVPQPKQKRTVKSRRRAPIQIHDIASPLNILDGLDLTPKENGGAIEKNGNTVTKPSEEEKEKKEVIVEKQFETPKKKIDSKPVVFKEANSPAKTMLPPLKPNTIKVVEEKISPLALFENSMIDYLRISLTEVQSSFLGEFKKAVDKCFNINDQVSKFLVQLEKDIINIVNDENEQKYESLPDVETYIISDFKQLFSELPKNSSKNNGVYFDETMSSFEQVKSLKQDFTSNCQKLISQLTQESQDSQLMKRKEDAETDEKLLELFNLEAKELQIRMEKEFIDKKLAIVKQQFSNIRENTAILTNSSSERESQPLVSEEFNELFVEIKDFSEKRLLRPQAKYTNEYKTILEEIMLMNTQIQSKSDSLIRVSTICQTQAPENEPQSCMSISIDSIGPHSRCGVVEDVRSRLTRMKKLREDTIADLHHHAPNFQIINSRPQKV